jgi:hypothetical protein
MNETNVMDLATEIADLEAVELKLLRIDADELDKTGKKQLADKLHECSTNLMKLRNADLANLSESFKSREPELRSAAGKLKDDLRELGDAVEIINTVSAAMETITEIISVIAIA